MAPSSALSSKLSCPDSAESMIDGFETESLRQRVSSVSLESVGQPYLPAKPNFKPRSYQLEVLERAREENTIIVMETGCGKTMIAVMLIHDMADCIRKPASKIAIFLAPTVPLVQQQAEVIESSTSLKVGCYWGGVADTLNHEYWEEEQEKNEVFVMTPQILLTNLRHCFLKMDMIEILIFDECHHARKKAQYAAIMNEFYFDQPAGRRPRVFGMTAVPIVGKGCTTGGCASMIDDLEGLLHAKVYTIRDKTELEHVNPSPVLSLCYYDSPYLPGYVRILQKRFTELKDECMKPLILEEKAGSKAAVELKAIIKQQKKLRKIFTTLDYCLTELGLWCTQKAAELLDNDDPECAGEVELESECKRAFLQKIRVELKAARSQDDNRVEISEDFSSKVYALLDLLTEYRDSDDLKCIVFVERVMAARVLAGLLSNLASFSFLRCKFLAGAHSDVKSMSRQQQQSLVEEFRAGKVNLLVATNIAEEGLDIQTCGLVIRFDLPPTLRSFVQSRGRARRLGSSYVLLVERGNSTAESCIQDLLDSEREVAEEACRRDKIERQPLHQQAHDMEIFRVESTGASVNTDCSVQLLHRYCSKLPGDKFYRPAPEFDFMQSSEGGVFCTVTLPPNAPFRHVVGHVCPTIVKGKQVACLEACKQLHACGALTDFLLLPSDLEDEEEAHFSFRKKSVAASRAAELYSMLVPSGLRGASIAEGAPARLHVYQICLAPEPADRQYAEFALFLETALDNELGSVKVRLNLSRGRTVTAKLKPAGQMCLDQYQIHQAKVFQTYIFTTVLDPNGHQLAPLFVGGKSIPVMEAWDPSLSYLLLPLLPIAQMELNPDAHIGHIQIDWLAVKKVTGTRGISPNGYCETEDPVYKEMSKELTSDGEVLQVADGLASVEDIVDAMVVIKHADHKAFYRVVEVIHELNSNSCFSDPIAYASYTEYFQRRHGETLVHTQQPLLRAKPMITVHNLLSMRSTGDSPVASKKELMVELPAELCKIRMLGFSGQIVNSISLLPSLMHRLESMLVANELRDNLAVGIPEAAGISTMKILSSLTTGKCGETFSLESLELLGDAFLKFAVSQRLFLVYEKKHEGQLTIRRARAICNSTLQKLGVARDLPAFIRDKAFIPQQWVVPGRWCRLTCDPDKLSEIHDSSEEFEGLGSITCSQSHRWIYHKTIADVVEALIGTHLVESGQNGALAFMRWVGITIDFDPVLKVQAQKRDEANAAHLDGRVLEIENKLNYTFRSKALAVEAVTHASYHDSLGHCYQRLEFLGDAVLDFLITKHLFSTFPGLKPGLLTDLRSASVNNDAFARVAVQHNIHLCLLHTSKHLTAQVKEFLSFLQLDPSETEVCHGWEGDKAPKVLGDLVESLAGAVLVDSDFSVDKVWAVFEPLLTPFATLDTLRMHPVRELQELCQLHGLDLQFDNTIHGKLISVTATVKVKDDLITEHAQRMDSKSAKRIAAQEALNQLQKLGYRHPRQSLIEALSTQRSKEEKNDIRVKPSLSLKPMELVVKDEQKDRQVTSCTDKEIWPCQPDPDKTVPCITRGQGDKIDPGVHCNEQDNPKSLPRPLSLRSVAPCISHKLDALKVDSPKEYLGPFGPKVKFADDSVNINLSIARPSANIQATKGDAEIGEVTETIDMMEIFQQQHCISGVDKSKRMEGSIAKSHQVESSQRGIVGSNWSRPQATLSNNMFDLNFILRTKLGTPGSRAQESSVVNEPVDYAPYLKMWSQRWGESAATSLLQKKESAATSTGAVPVKSGSTNKERKSGTCRESNPAVADGRAFGRPVTTERQCGEPRSRLYETCDQKKWPRPQFLWLNVEAGGGTVKFQCDVKVEIPSRHTVLCKGDIFCNKREAMDSAASFALDWLTQEGLL